MGCGNGRIFCADDWLCGILRSYEMRGEIVTLESFIMLTVSVATGIYLLYALLRPEKF